MQQEFRIGVRGLREPYTHTFILPFMLSSPFEPVSASYNDPGLRSAAAISASFAFASVDLWPELEEVVAATSARQLPLHVVEAAYQVLRA